jgi:hypothetical protein
MFYFPFISRLGKRRRQAMTGNVGDAQPGAAKNGGHALVRWECRCQHPPVLLGTYDAQGRINIKARDRYWHIQGVVQTVCPRCGSEHRLDLSRQDGETASRQESSRCVE